MVSSSAQIEYSAHSQGAFVVWLGVTDFISEKSEILDIISHFLRYQFIICESIKLFQILHQ